MTDTLTYYDFAAVYGRRSVRIAGQAAEVVAGSSLSLYDIVFQIIALVVLGVYCWMVYYFREQIAMALKSVVNLKSEERPGSENKQLADRFLVAAMALGCVVSAIFAAKIFTPLGAGVALVVFVVVMAQFLVLKLAGGLTFTTELTGRF